MPRIIFGDAALRDHLHHLLRLLELVQELVHLLHRDAAPAAMRRLRDALMSSGLARSTGVIESMMPSSGAILRSSTDARACAAARARRQLVEHAGDAAHLAHLRDLALKSVRSKPLPT
jgi:hypothetical protein